MATRVDTTTLKPFERDEKWCDTWQATENALLASNLNVKVLNSTYMLKNEGWTMHTASVVTHTLSKSDILTSFT